MGEILTVLYAFLRAVMKRMSMVGAIIAALSVYGMLGTGLLAFLFADTPLAPKAVSVFFMVGVIGGYTFILAWLMEDSKDW